MGADLRNTGQEGMESMDIWVAAATAGAGARCPKVMAGVSAWAEATAEAVATSGWANTEACKTGMGRQTVQSKSTK